MNPLDVEQVLFIDLRTAQIITGQQSLNVIIGRILDNLAEVHDCFPSQHDCFSHAITHLNAKDIGSQQKIRLNNMALGIIDSSP
ncbi:hypothetical protein [Pseudomonas fluorescens]|uniref:hypothetical protein n=1 Tax=Pseudomonas fluorescens TaxID=294 RepID=UPI00163B2975|nr:hypothetical protein [Pseudomonas fluorescens]